MSATKTPQQIANLREALEVWWPSVPEANVYPELAWYTAGNHNDTDCGTIACFGGWCARWPALVAQGVRLQSGMPAGRPRAAHLFGDDFLWSRRGNHPADFGFVGTDHACVTNRLRWALEH